MKASTFMILALLGAAPVAAASENDVKAIIQLPAAAPAPHQAIHHHRTALSRAKASALASMPEPFPLDDHRRDGLSRNPDECLKFGCIDGGGN